MFDKLKKKVDDSVVGEKAEALVDKASDVVATDPDAATGLLPAGAPVLVLLSGGRDSTCLLHLATTLGADTRALHVHHGLRPEAEPVSAEPEAGASAAPPAEQPTRARAATEARARAFRRGVRGERCMVLLPGGAVEGRLGSRGSGGQAGPRRSGEPCLSRLRYTDLSYPPM